MLNDFPFTDSMSSNILSSPSNYEPSESSGSPLKLIKRKRTWYSSLETSNLTSAQEDEESSNEEGMKLRPPSSSGRKQISLCIVVHFCTFLIHKFYIF